MSKIHAYINFKSNCAEAMSFYRDCLGGVLSVQLVKDSPMKDMFPPQLQGIVLHASLENKDITLLGSDMPLEQDNGGSGAVSLMLACDSVDELKASFEKISSGGTILHPVEKFFAGTIGNCIDRFGIRWSAFCAM